MTVGNIQIEDYTLNKVLSVRPPQITVEKVQLPRNTRMTLEKLRSGSSKVLNKISSEIDDKCPSCNSTPHEVHSAVLCN